MLSLYLTSQNICQHFHPSLHSDYTYASLQRRFWLLPSYELRRLPPLASFSYFFSLASHLPLNMPASPILKNLSFFTLFLCPTSSCFPLLHSTKFKHHRHNSAPCISGNICLAPRFHDLLLPQTKHSVERTASLTFFTAVSLLTHCSAFTQFLFFLISLFFSWNTDGHCPPPTPPASLPGFSLVSYPPLNTGPSPESDKLEEVPCCCQSTAQGVKPSHGNLFIWQWACEMSRKASGSRIKWKASRGAQGNILLPVW